MHRPAPPRLGRPLQRGGGARRTAGRRSGSRRLGARAGCCPSYATRGQDGSAGSPHGLRGGGAGQPACFGLDWLPRPRVLPPRREPIPRGCRRVSPTGRRARPAAYGQWGRARRRSRRGWSSRAGTRRGRSDLPRIIERRSQGRVNVGRSLRRPSLVSTAEGGCPRATPGVRSHGHLGGARGGQKGGGRCCRWPPSTSAAHMRAGLARAAAVAISTSGQRRANGRPFRHWRRRRSLDLSNMDSGSGPDGARR